MIKLFTYQLPFRQPFKTSKGTFENRNGLIITFSDERITAFGEIAPLPGFSKFTLKDIIPVLQINRSVIQQALLYNDFEQLASVLYQVHNIPSFKFGLDTLFHDYQAKTKEQPLAHLIFDKPASSIKTNATLGLGSIEELKKQTEKLIAQGFTTLKVKVGYDFETELNSIKTLRDAYPDLKIRMDANQAWNFKTAQKNLKQLEKLDIEYCEEPLSKDHISQLNQLKEQVNIPIAADESFRNKKDAQELIQQNAVDILILKPMMLGSFSEINATMELANSHGIDVVLTTSLESIIGRTVTGALTMGWGTKKYAHGLSTGSLLQQDLAERNEIISGNYQLPELPGLGINVNYNYLKEIT